MYVVKCLFLGKETIFLSWSVRVVSFHSFTHLELIEAIKLGRFKCYADEKMSLLCLLDDTPRCRINTHLHTCSLEIPLCLTCLPSCPFTTSEPTELRSAVSHPRILLESRRLSLQPLSLLLQVSWEKLSYSPSPKSTNSKLTLGYRSNSVLLSPQCDYYIPATLQLPSRSCFLRGVFCHCQVLPLY